MTALVSTVEELDITIGPGQTVGTALFTLGQDADQLVPFFTLEADITTGADHPNSLCRATINDLSNEVELERFGTVGTVVAKIYLVEFNAAIMTVQAISYSVSGAITPVLDFSPNATGLTKTFFFNTYLSGVGGADSDDFNDNRIQVDAIAINDVRMERSGTAGILQGICYGVCDVVGSGLENVIVEHLTAAPAQGNTLTNIPITDVSNTLFAFILGSFQGGHTGDDNGGGSWIQDLETSIQIRWARNTGGGAAYGGNGLSSQVVRPLDNPGGGPNQTQREQWVWFNTPSTIQNDSVVTDNLVSPIVIPAVDCVGNTRGAGTGLLYRTLTRQRDLSPTVIRSERSDGALGDVGNMQVWDAIKEPFTVQIDMPIATQVLNTSRELLRVGRLLDILWRERS